MLRPAKCHLLQAEYLLWVSCKERFEGIAPVVKIDLKALRLNCKVRFEGIAPGQNHCITTCRDAKII